jgi:hypothetical protein
LEEPRVGGIGLERFGGRDRATVGVVSQNARLVPTGMIEDVEDVRAKFEVLLPECGEALEE